MSAVHHRNARGLFSFAGEFAVTVKSKFIRFVRFITFGWLIPAGHSRPPSKKGKRAGHSQRSVCVRGPACLDLPETTELRDIGSLVL